MASFELIYEEEEDVLEVTFALFDEHFARAIALNDNLLLHTDSNVTTAWGLTLYSYGQLLQVSETHLDNLREFPEDGLRRVLRVIATPPVSYFLELLDPDGLRALVKAPNLQAMLSV